MVYLHDCIFLLNKSVSISLIYFISFIWIVLIGKEISRVVKIHGDLMAAQRQLRVKRKVTNWNITR